MEHSETIINKEYKDINPRIFGWQNCKPSHHYGPALRTHWLLHFVVKGKGYFRVGNQKYTLSEGNIFVIRPFEETYYEADHESPWEYIWIGFDKGDAVPMPNDDVLYVPWAVELFEDMKRCAAMKGGKTEFLCAKIWQLISQISENTNDPVDSIQTALHIIHSEYMLGVTVQEIADRLHMDRTYFFQLFKRRLGISPKQYLMNYRMEQAVKLLDSHGYDVSVTALSVGYTDVYTFSKAFKKHWGVSPSEYKV